MGANPDSGKEGAGILSRGGRAERETPECEWPRWADVLMEKHTTLEGSKSTSPGGKRCYRVSNDFLRTELKWPNSWYRANTQKAMQGWSQEEHGTKDRRRKNPEPHRSGADTDKFFTGSGEAGPPWAVDKPSREVQWDPQICSQPWQPGAEALMHPDPTGQAGWHLPLPSWQTQDYMEVKVLGKLPKI